mmetsp:Transcript_60028/g.115775  ORF Transcript_60028/g.115775 Transcript_60028/m.115775 type:complete len:87 (-) Transcript_60028:95-355(-)
MHESGCQALHHAERSLLTAVFMVIDLITDCDYCMHSLYRMPPTHEWCVGVACFCCHSCLCCQSLSFAHGLTLDCMREAHKEMLSKQ